MNHLKYPNVDPAVIAEINYRQERCRALLAGESLLSIFTRWVARAIHRRFKE